MQVTDFTGQKSVLNTNYLFKQKASKRKRDGSKNGRNSNGQLSPLVDRSITGNFTENMGARSPMV